MIEIVARSGPPDALNCPAFICDACRRQVTGRGNIYWVVKNSAEHFTSSPLFVSHKGRCVKPAEKLVESLYPAADGWSRTLWSELGTFLGQLAHNAENDFSEDADGIYHNHQLVQPYRGVLPALPDAPDTRRPAR